MIEKVIKENKMKLEGKWKMKDKTVNEKYEQNTIFKLKWVNEKFARKMKQKVKHLSESSRIGIRIVWTTNPLKKWQYLNSGKVSV